MLLLFILKIKIRYLIELEFILKRKGTKDYCYKKEIMRNGREYGKYKSTHTYRPY